MKNFSTFQLAIIGLFILFLIVGVLIFAGILPGFRQPSGGAAGELSVWGTVSEQTLAPIIARFNDTYKRFFTLRYTAKPASAIEREFVAAKADGRAPDLLLLPHELGLTQRARLAVLPSELISLRQYQETFADVGNFYLSSAGASPTSGGASALPLLVDPLVLYFNKTLMNGAGLAVIPKTWTEFVAKTANLTILDSRRNVLQSAIALGETRNIAQAKDILAMLLLEAGNPITVSDGGKWRSSLNQDLGSTLKPAVAVLDFYTQFSDPARPNYSWNRSLPEARAAFGRGQSVFYLGYASEYLNLKLENPHLEFDVALPPQKDERSKLTLARLLAIAVVKDGSKAPAAAAAALDLAGADFVKALAEALYLPPARRDLLNRDANEPALALFGRAALVGRTWFDPDPIASQKIFVDMVESVVTGRAKPVAAVAAADQQLQALIDRIYGDNQ